MLIYTRVHPKSTHAQTGQVQKPGEDDRRRRRTGDEPATKSVPAGSKVTKATKGGNKKANGQGKKKGGRTPSPNMDENPDAVLTPPPSGRPKRQGAKRDYVQLAEGNHDDDEDDGLDKKVKIQVGEVSNSRNC